MSQRARIAKSLAHSLLLAVAAVAPTTVVTAQQAPRRTVETPIDFSTSQNDNLFSLLRSQEQIHAFEEALAEIAAGEHRAGVERLHRLLQIESGGVVPVAPGRFLGLRVAVITSMANLPPAAQAAYEELVLREGGGGGALVDCTEQQLRQLTERFPTAKIGLSARLRLGDLALNAGDARQAVGHFRAALDATAFGSTDERRVAERLHCANLLIDPETARSDGAAGRLGQVGDDVLTVLPLAAGHATWKSFGGGGSGRTPMTPIAGRPDVLCKRDFVAPGFVEGERDIGLFAMFPVGDLDGIFINTGHKLVAFDPLRQEELWQSESPMSAYVDRVPSWQQERQSSGINQDMALAAACNDDVVVAALQVPEKSMDIDFQNSFRVMSKIPMRRLYAFHRQSGNLLWSHYDELDGPRTRLFRGHDACANPVLSGDTVYLPVHDRAGAIAFSIAAYDVRTGKPKWKRLVCSSQQDVNMFGNARTEFAASPLCLHGGVLFGASNLGVAYAIEAATGRTRWISSYEVVRMPLASMHRQQDRMIYFANNSPVVTDGVVCMTPLDSQFVLGLDAESGRTEWRLPPQATVEGTDNRILWLAGAMGDEFVLSGIGAIAVKARPGTAFGADASARQLVRPEQLSDRRNGGLPPRPAVTHDAVWFARADGILAFDGRGKPLPDSPFRVPQLLPGNLLLIGGIAVALRQQALHIAYDAAALSLHVEKQAQDHPDDPAILLRLASLRRALLPDAPSAAVLEAVQQIYRQGLQAAVRKGLPKSHAVRQALQLELYQQAFHAADLAMRSGNPEALALLAAARDVAPDTARWIDVQAIVLARSATNPSQFAAELDRLLTNAGDATFPLGEGVPVRAWVAWQRALAATTATSAVALWQELIEQHGDQRLGDTMAATLAQLAIAERMRSDGPACYAAIEARAEAALLGAGNDRAALELISNRFPNSPTATTARVRLLDAAVREGDLTFTCGVLADAMASGPVPPNVARRVIVAANLRGNHALAAAMAGLLRAHADTVSDWPEDAGARFGEVLAKLPAFPSTGPAPVPLPIVDVATFAPPAAGEVLRLLPVLPVAGFAAAANTPLYVWVGNELLAIDVQPGAADKSVLFQLPVDYLDHVIVCGTTLIVPDMERVFAVDYRSGELRWQHPTPRRQLLESLGLQQGVLHFSVQSNTAEGHCEFLGIEPLTGVQLFSHSQEGLTCKPKAIDGALLRLTVFPDGGATVQRLDAVRGTATQTITIAASVLKAHLQLEPDTLSARLYPQNLCSDGERVFLPSDSSLSRSAPRLVAIANDGSVAWHWRGTQGSQRFECSLRGDRLVLCEGGDREESRVILLNARDGSVLREAKVGHDATLLNWHPSWLANPAPECLAIESFIDVDRSQRQLVCFGVADSKPTFALPLGKEDGEVLQAPLFGPDFVTFGTRGSRNGNGVRLWAVSLADRSGLLPDGRKSRLLNLPGTSDSMSQSGPHVVVAGARGLVLLGTQRGNR